MSGPAGSTPRRVADRCGGAFNAAVSLTVDGDRITRIHELRNPRKLARLNDAATLTH